MKNIHLHIKFKATFCLLALFLLCSVVPLHAASKGHDDAHATTSHQSEHSSPQHGEEVAHTEDGHETTHAEHGDTHETHGTTDTHEAGHGDGHEATGHGDGHGDGHKTAGEHGNGHGDGHDGHHAPAPFLYYLLWGLLAFTFIITCSYCLWVYKRGKPKHEGLGLAFLLVLLVIVMYTLDQSPEVLRHWDAASHQFVDGYHESPGMGFVKFIYKMGLGVLLTTYGIIGREHH